jgi:hypothetical protein
MHQAFAVLQRGLADREAAFRYRPTVAGFLRT